MAPQAPMAMVPQLVQTNAGQQIVYAQAQQQQPQMAMMMMPNGQLQQVALVPQQFQMQQLAAASQQTMQLASMAALPAAANLTSTVASSSFTTSTVASVSPWPLFQSDQQWKGIAFIILSCLKAISKLKLNLSIFRLIYSVRASQAQ